MLISSIFHAFILFLLIIGLTWFLLISYLNFSAYDINVNLNGRFIQREIITLYVAKLRRSLVLFSKLSFYYLYLHVSTSIILQVILTLRDQYMKIVIHWIDFNFNIQGFMVPNLISQIFRWKMMTAVWISNHKMWKDDDYSLWAWWWVWCIGFSLSSH